MGGIDKKSYIKQILKDLTKGLDPTEAKEKIKQDIGTIESQELFTIENELIQEGISPEEIRKFCNVHALLFEGMFENKISDPSNLSHPVNIMKSENREIEKIIYKIKDAFQTNNSDILLKSLNDLESIVRLHFQRKEQILFPLLEKHKFYGPSQVMWAKDDEVRSLIKKAIKEFKVISKEYETDYLNPMIEEVLSMIYKEENVLYPTTLEKLSANEWVDVFRQSADIGYILIKVPEEVFIAEDINKRAISESKIENGYITLPTGKVKLEELRIILNTLPLDISFIDTENNVRYYSHSPNRIFVRTPSVIGRNVENCHPPKSVDAVKKVIEDLKTGKKKSHDFWFNMQEKFIFIRYLPVRDEFGNYLGILEVTQDITEIKKLEGEKRLVE